MSTASQAQSMKGQGKGRLWLAAGLGLVAAVLVIVFLNSLDGDEVLPPTPMRSVVVASEPIPAGEAIRPDQLTVRDLPETSVAADALTDRTLVEGRIARYPIGQGEQLSPGRLVDAPQVQALSFQIPEGKRGMTIPVSIDKTPAALFAPGDFVDVIVSVEVTLLGIAESDLPPVFATETAEEDEDLRGATTLLQNLQVLSVDRTYVDTGVVYEDSTRGTPREEDENIGFVTLAVTPEQAQLLWLAQDNGNLTLVLRPFGDDQITQLSPVLEPFNLQP